MFSIFISPHPGPLPQGEKEFPDGSKTYEFLNWTYELPSFSLQTPGDLSLSCQVNGDQMRRNFSVSRLRFAEDGHRVRWRSAGNWPQVYWG